MIRRPPRSTRKESSAASDVYKRQVWGLPQALWERSRRPSCSQSIPKPSYRQPGCSESTPKPSCRRQSFSRHPILGAGLCEWAVRAAVLRSFPLRMPPGLGLNLINAGAGHGPGFGPCFEQGETMRATHRSTYSSSSPVPGAQPCPRGPCHCCPLSGESNSSGGPSCAESATQAMWWPTHDTCHKLRTPRFKVRQPRVPLRLVLKVRHFSRVSSLCRGPRKTRQAGAVGRGFRYTWGLLSRHHPRCSLTRM